MVFVGEAAVRVRVALVGMPESATSGALAIRSWEVEELDRAAPVKLFQTLDPEPIAAGPDTPALVPAVRKATLSGGTEFFWAAAITDKTVSLLVASGVTRR